MLIFTFQARMQMHLFNFGLLNSLGTIKSFHLELEYSETTVLLEVECTCTPYCICKGTQSTYSNNAAPYLVEGQVLRCGGGIRGTKAVYQLQSCSHGQGIVSYLQCQGQGLGQALAGLHQGLQGGGLTHL